MPVSKEIQVTFIISVRICSDKFLFVFSVVYSLDGQITNVIFWAVTVLVGLSVFGYNVEALLITLAGLLVSFAFMISSASSKYVEVRSFSVRLITYFVSFNS